MYLSLSLSLFFTLSIPRERWSSRSAALGDVFKNLSAPATALTIPARSVKSQSVSIGACALRGDTSGFVQKGEKRRGKEISFLST